MSITIRAAVPNDYEAVKTLYSQMLAEFAQNYPDQYRAEGAIASLKLQTFLNTLENEDWAFLVATEDTTIKGVMQLSVDADEDSEYRHPHTYVWIEELIVDSGASVEEIGTPLIEAAQVWAREKEIKNMDIIVYHIKPALLQLCQKLGFGTVSTRLRKEA